MKQSTNPDFKTVRNRLFNHIFAAPLIYAVILEHAHFTIRIQLSRIKAY